MPPKSSVWGHKLGKMLPKRQKDLFEEFLKRATAKHEFRLGSLNFSVRRPGFEQESEEVTARFEQALGIKALNNHFFPKLDRSQFATCLQMMIAEPSLVPNEKVHVILSEIISVTDWLIDGKPSPTNSEFMLQYGSLPCISTFLTFQSLEEFRSIQGVLSELRFCKLNEKHLKPVKSRARKG